LRSSPSGLGQAALCLAAGAVLQQRAAARAPAPGLRATRSASMSHSSACVDRRRHRYLGSIRASGDRFGAWGALSGMTFGLADALDKATIGSLDSGHPAVGLGWQLWLTAAAGLGGFVLMHIAYRATELQASFPASTFLSLSAVRCSVVLFSEHFRTVGSRPYVQVAAAVAMTLGVISLARSPVVAAALSGRQRAAVYSPTEI
jgi:hypothetical protein